MAFWGYWEPICVFIPRVGFLFQDISFRMGELIMTCEMTHGWLVIPSVWTIRIIKNNRRKYLRRNTGQDGRTQGVPPFIAYA